MLQFDGGYAGVISMGRCNTGSFTLLKRLPKNSYASAVVKAVCA